MINLHERMLPTLAGVEPATSWSPVGRTFNWATEVGLTKLKTAEVSSFLGQTSQLGFISGPDFNSHKFRSGLNDPKHHKNMPV